MYCVAIMFQICFYEQCQLLKTFKYIRTGFKMNSIKFGLYVPNM